MNIKLAKRLSFVRQPLCIFGRSLARSNSTISFPYFLLAFAKCRPCGYRISSLFSIFGFNYTVSLIKGEFSFKKALLSIQTPLFQTKMTYLSSQYIMFVRTATQTPRLTFRPSEPLPKRRVCASVRANRHPNAPFVLPSE